MSEIKKIGFIGAGNMALAIIKGIARAGLPSKLLAYDKDREKISALLKYDIVSCETSAEVARDSDYILLAVKPQNITEALEEIKPAFSQDTVIISIAAGITPQYIAKQLCSEDAEKAKKIKVVQVMPNTPLMLSCGATAIAANAEVSDSEFAFAKAIFDCAGITEVISLDKMNEIIPINGSSPAFIYEFAAEFLKYGKAEGIAEDVSLRLFAQTLIGSAKMLTESGYSINELIEMVSSKGGTTIAGLNAMRKNGFSEAIQVACDECRKRAYELTLE